jgi:hypothetical protein
MRTRQLEAHRGSINNSCLMAARAEFSMSFNNFCGSDDGQQNGELYSSILFDVYTTEWNHQVFFFFVIETN